ncbi:MAG: class I SAM-dependent methyltransferase [Spirochaetota bacterium]
MNDMDIVEYNRKAWNKEVDRKNPWTVPVCSEVINQARQGSWELVLTPRKAVPRSWFGDIRGMDILCLASGGGQQGPILAAAGAHVTVCDNSEAQLASDRKLSDQFNLGITTVQRDMRNLACFDDDTFDLVFHPVSNLFIEDPLPVWRECFRVLKPGGHLLSGFCNPVIFMFPDEEQGKDNLLRAIYQLPYSDILHRDGTELKHIMDQSEPLEFGHTLTQQIGGQLTAGFVITDMYEDSFGETALEQLTDTFIATRARKER